MPTSIRITLTSEEPIIGGVGMSSKHSDREEDGVVFLHVRRADSIDERLEDTKDTWGGVQRAAVDALLNRRELSLGEVISRRGPAHCRAN